MPIDTQIPSSEWKVKIPLIVCSFTIKDQESRPLYNVKSSLNVYTKQKFYDPETKQLLGSAKAKSTNFAASKGYSIICNPQNEVLCVLIAESYHPCACYVLPSPVPKANFSFEDFTAGKDECTHLRVIIEGKWVKLLDNEAGCIVQLRKTKKNHLHPYYIAQTFPNSFFPQVISDIIGMGIIALDSKLEEVVIVPIVVPAVV
uniref:Uncharacterized protein n=1 Tax=Vannella robusta TaxID=1487602 RepID=A0A7S4I273_9EUKA|mmetsp:Transcript_19174/g.24205  ORF Transcript_19174/g.24205 Transcript_19174/m.24205 type:complete len:202 (+) Transcript_19174:194-799(+)